MVKLITKGYGANNNSLEFYQVSHLGVNSMVVRDNDSQLERVYTIGNTQELDDFEQVEIVSFEQVIKAWLDGTVWF